MIKLTRALAVLVVPCLLSACGLTGMNSSTTLAPTRFHYVNIWETYDLRVDIDNTGSVSVQEQTGSQASDIHQAQTQLTPEQRRDILAAFRDWNHLKSAYPGDIGPLYEISYNGYNVSAGVSDKTPPAFLNAQSILERIGRTALHPTPAAIAPPAPAAAPAAPAAPIPANPGMTPPANIP